MFEAADEYYEAIRASTTDIARIAGNTGYKAANIRKIKEHLFFNEHLLDRYTALGIPATIGRFDSNMSIAQAWRRLENGSHSASDLQLFRHETAEAWYMRNVAPGYNQAHNVAARRYPVPELGE